MFKVTKLNVFEVTMHTTPWYKQFWPWFLIALPATAVIAGLSTVVIAVNHHQDLVAEDYYKKGKAINKDLTRLAAAKARHLLANLYIDEGELTISLQGELGSNIPITVSFVHKTLADRDQTFILTADANGTYRTDTQFLPEGRWMVQIGDLQQTWQLQETLVFPLYRPHSIDAS
jgi:hypothetical protein